MRLICTISEEEKLDFPAQELAYQFCYFLSRHGIENECEQSLSSSGSSIYTVWVVDEDQADEALKLYEEFKANPKKAMESQPSTSQLSQEAIYETEELPQNEEASIRTPRHVPYGKVTLAILFAAILIFIWGQFQRPDIPQKLPGIPEAPNLAPLEKTLLYDYPLFFHLRDQLLTIYTPKEIESKQAPSKEAETLLKEMKKTPYWKGFYDLAVQYFKNPEKPIEVKGPLFEKIRQGEAWRLFTPVLLHYDLLHIFFNVIWFILLGNQIEYRIGSFRYILLIVIGALLSNTAQYFVSGPFFLGLSGVVTTLAGFIWARQRKAPWEGYLVSRLTLLFLFFFIVGMFALQVIFFFTEITGKFSLTIGIANTAHLIGLLVGYLLGRLKFFSIKHFLR